MLDTILCTSQTLANLSLVTTLRSRHFHYPHQLDGERDVQSWACQDDQLVSGRTEILDPGPDVAPEFHFLTTALCSHTNLECFQLFLKALVLGNIDEKRGQVHVTASSQNSAFRWRISSNAYRRLRRCESPNLIPSTALYNIWKAIATCYLCVHLWMEILKLIR